jgi:hypothetical protein
MALDQRVRLAAFEFLREQQAVRTDEVLPRRVLAAGFQFEGQRVPLIGPQGIFKPAILPEIPLTITTDPIIDFRDRQLRSPEQSVFVRTRNSLPSGTNSSRRRSERQLLTSTPPHG